MSTVEVPDDDLEGNLGDLLRDDELESEIELVSVLVLAATSSDRPLREDEVDSLLGVDPKGDSPDAVTDS